ncbi:L,D-transpeptidase family protein [Streptomyces sp. RPT161]|uniref:L,D-transpeptidase family protein n=1 Tax=Streptomyces sp. RPT161 TaxID=3015993 RepID=UPI0022B934CB|nr:L,D-transpeptidase family protein [Streptomyces sp. RPT161]
MPPYAPAAGPEPRSRSAPAAPQQRTRYVSERPDRVDDGPSAGPPDGRPPRHRTPDRDRLTWLICAGVGLGVLGTTALYANPGAMFRSTRSASAEVRPTHHAVAPPAAQPRPSVRRLPGIGARFGSAIPANARQALVVVGQGPGSWMSTATLWSRDDHGDWHPSETWTAHNALRGWTPSHRMDDLRSPIGVFSLTAAGGLAPNPGTRLPYDHSPAFRAVGAGFEGEPLTGSFDYVVAIDYNRVPGSSPLDPRTPLGRGRGAGLWVHVDHQGPTHGCVALSREHMVELLRKLDPAAHPVIVMGDKAALRQ